MAASRTLGFAGAQFRQRSISSSFRHAQLAPRASRALWERQLQFLHHSSRRGYASSAATDARSLSTRLKNLFLGTTISASLILGYFYITDTRAAVHRWLVVPALRWLYPDAEDAHEAGTKALRALYSFGLHPRERTDPDKDNGLQIDIFGHTLRNPIGTSAGIDKHAEIPDALLAFGPAIVEVGGVTPYPQDGNPKPRVFRLPSQRAFINRYGLNSEGADAMAMRLRQRVREYAYAMGFGLDEVAEQQVLDGEAGVPPGSLVEGKLLAVQVSKNKFTPDSDLNAVANDYVYCVDALAKYADILVVNVSSPNTPGLRDMQRVEPLTKILTAVVGAAKKAERKTKPAVMVKVSPDEDSEEQISGICEAIFKSGVDGVIVGNTTKTRPDPLPAGCALPGKEAAVLLEQGGYSGPQLFNKTVSLVKRYRKLLDEKSLRSGPSQHSGSKPLLNDAPPQKFQPAAASPLEPSETNEVKPSIPKRDNSSSITRPSQYEDVEGSIHHDLANLKPNTPEAHADSKQPIIKLPERHTTSSSTRPSQHDDVEASIPHNLANLKPNTPEAHADSKQPIIKLPERHTTTSSATPSISTSPTLSPTSSSSPSTSKPAHDSPIPTSLTSQSAPSDPKVIFATGGITNGKQALEVLNAGADVAMVYTALVYGGVGTISRIKQEMREEMKKKRVS